MLYYNMACWSTYVPTTHGRLLCAVSVQLGMQFLQESSSLSAVPNPQRFVIRNSCAAQLGTTTTGFSRGDQLEESMEMVEGFSPQADATDVVTPNSWEFCKMSREVPHYCLPAAQKDLPLLSRVHFLCMAVTAKMASELHEPSLRRNLYIRRTSTENPDITTSTMVKIHGNGSVLWVSIN